MYIYIYEYIYIYVGIYTYIYEYICRYVYTYVYIYNVHFMCLYRLLPGVLQSLDVHAPRRGHVAAGEWLLEPYTNTFGFLNPWANLAEKTLGRRLWFLLEHESPLHVILVLCVWLYRSSYLQRRAPKDCAHGPSRHSTWFSSQ